MRGNRFTESLDPNEKNISFTTLLVLAFWYDIFFPQNTYMGRLFEEGTSPLYIESPLYTALFGWIPTGSIGAGLLSFLALFCVAGMMTRFNGHFAYIKVRTILPAIIFSMIGTALFCHTLTPGMLIAVLLMSALFSSFFFVETFIPIYAFNTGLLTAMLSLLSPTLLLLSIPYLTFLYSTSTLNLRSLLASAFGLAVPLLYATLYYAIVGEIETLSNFFIAGFQPFSTEYNFSNMEIAYVIFLGLTSIIAIGNFIVDKTHDNIKSRKQNTHINSLFLWILFLMAMGAPDSKNLLYALTLLWGLMLGRYFSVNSGRLTYILTFALLGITLATYFIA